MNRPARSRGFTLVEAMIVIAVSAIVLALAVPSFGSLGARHRLTDAAETLSLDLREARWQAVQRGTPVYVQFTAGPQWCYAVSAQPGCTCSAGATAKPACALKTVDGSEFRHVTLQSGSGVLFDGALGRTSPGAAATLSVDDRYAAQVQLAASGRASVCASGDTMAGYPRC